MAHHARMVNRLVKGILQIRTGQRELFFVLDSGVLEVGPQNQVLILADNALPAKDPQDARQKIQELP
jgi:F0F1-type ATP synthase epsilon subunit